MLIEFYFFQYRVMPYARRARWTAVARYQGVDSNGWRDWRPVSRQVTIGAINIVGLVRGLSASGPLRARSGRPRRHEPTRQGANEPKTLERSYSEREAIMNLRLRRSVLTTTESQTDEWACGRTGNCAPRTGWNPALPREPTWDSRRRVEASVNNSDTGTRMRKDGPLEKPCSNHSKGGISKDTGCRIVSRASPGGGMGNGDELMNRCSPFCRGREPGGGRGPPAAPDTNLKLDRRGKLRPSDVERFVDRSLHSDATRTRRPAARHGLAGRPLGPTRSRMARHKPTCASDDSERAGG